MRKKEILVYLLMLSLLTGCGNNKYKVTEEKINDYIEQISNLTTKVNNLTNENNELREKLEQYESLEEGECKFTRTYRVVDILDYQTDDNTAKYVILDQFQENLPFIVNLPNDQVAILVKGENYEFSFSGDKKYKNSEHQKLFANFQLNNIKKTDRVGLDQIQEECR